MTSNNGMISAARIHFLKLLHNRLQAEDCQYLTFNISISSLLQQGAHMQWLGLCILLWNLQISFKGFIRKCVQFYCILECQLLDGRWWSYTLCRFFIHIFDIFLIFRKLRGS